MPLQTQQTNHPDPAAPTNRSGRARDSSAARIPVRLVGLLALSLLSPALAAASAPRQEAAPDSAEEASTAELDTVLASLGWLVGRWEGEGLDGTVEEVWLPPRAGRMMGLFRLTRGDEHVFSEILAIGRFDDRIEMRLKHFDAQLHGWEERTDVTSFAFEAIGDDRVRFRGLELIREERDALRIELQLRNGERTWTEVFRFRRVD